LNFLNPRIAFHTVPDAFSSARGLTIRYPFQEISMSGSQNQRRVFLVDDEQLIASTLARILNMWGFDATSFTEPLVALEAARAQAPDLLISDIVMPQLSGVELAVQVQGDCPQCKVILFSGQTSTSEFLAAHEEKARRFEMLSKPVHPEDLLKAIERIFELEVAQKSGGFTNSRNV
jgi:DNA-binding NtrC family response regulator